MTPLPPLMRKRTGQNSRNGFRHITVLLHETVDMLKAGPGKILVDCTLGGGGHTELLLEQGATVWGIDRDADARRAAMLRLARFGSRFKVLAGNFQDVESILSQQGVSGWTGCWRTWAFPPTSLTPPPAAFPLGKTALWTCGWIPEPLSPPGTW